MAHVVFRRKGSLAKVLRAAADSCAAGAQLAELPLPAPEDYGMQRACVVLCTLGARACAADNNNWRRLAAGARGRAPAAGGAAGAHQRQGDGL